MLRDLRAFSLLALAVAAACAPAPTPTSTATAPPATAISSDAIADDEARQLMEALVSDSSIQAARAVERIAAAEDQRFVAVLLELLRASQIGIVPPLMNSIWVDGLTRLSGQPFGGDWFAWVEWYGGTDLTPPPGFTGWKGRLLARIDPGFGEFLRDDAPARLRVEEIQWGGVRVDGIPALDDARMIPAAQADYLEPGEPVFGLSINGDSRAYPLRILDWHEMANDVVGGVPVSLAYCTLCGAGIAFDGRAADGRTFTFGSSGFLYRSNKLMYDRQTRTLWNQITGRPVLGTLAGDDVRLEVLPIVLTTWADWQAQHPGTQVLDLDTGFARPYAPGAAYGDYFASPDTMFPVWQRGQALPAKARVFALNLNEVAKAYPLEALTREQVVNDAVGGAAVVLIAQRGPVRVEGLNQRIGQVTYDAGGEVRAYARGGHTFRPGPEPGSLIDEAGRAWRVSEAALVGPEGERAPRLGGHLAYWFGWYAFFPHTLVYGQP